MLICETPRLSIRRLDATDAPFILRLLNEPSFLQNIGDRGVRSLDDARAYLTRGPFSSYEQHGFGLFHVSLRPGGQGGPGGPSSEVGNGGDAIGMCGLLQRDWLDAPDVGFAFFPEFWSKGYACESSTGVIEWGRRTLGITRVVGIVKPGNIGSIRVLEKLGMKFMREVTSPEGLASSLYVPD
jgi:ribosomal-protein-alanine N-acetyltransferase